MQSYNEQHTKGKLLATCLTLIVIAGLVLVADHLKTQHAAGSALSASSTTGTSQSATTTVPATTTMNTSTTSSNYRDGTYSADSQYYVPHGYEDIKVTLTLQNGVVTGSQIANSENDGTSAEFQQLFADSYKHYVVGKSINSIHLSYVAGASDTTNGFNDALSQIKSKAQA